ncbi:MAG TPA: tyrosine-protein phosphatase [Acidimicrobiales bacterium]|nr:tyrosine-protein phosphatase [Acidimicrobiales bacterium]
MTSLAQRTIPFSAAFNVRDLGGLPTRDGVVRRGALYRADGLHRLPEDDVARLRAVGIRTVVDLRTHQELGDAGRLTADDITVVHLPVLRTIWSGEVDDASDAVEFLVARYVEMLTEGAAAISGVFDLVGSQRCRPLAFHCSAGKDRTGVVAALVLSALGASDDVIADDYQCSAAAMQRLVDWITTHRPEAADTMAKQPSAFLECPREAMHGFLDEVRARHGSVIGYLASIGVTEAQLRGLRTALVEPRSRRSDVGLLRRDDVG